jgi:prepilin-type processing-associated H-X9-DG protein
LLSLLLPSLNNARESARQMACAGNLRQITLASVSFSVDYAGQLPYIAGYSNWHGQVPLREWSDSTMGGGWGYISASLPNTEQYNYMTSTMVDQYLNGAPQSEAAVTHVLRCPSDSHPMKDTDALGCPPGYQNRKGFSNYYYLGQIGWYRMIPTGVGLANCRSNGTSIFGDSTKNGFTTNNVERLQDRWRYPYVMFEDWINARGLNSGQYVSNHGWNYATTTGANTSYYDGHVSWTGYYWGGEQLASGIAQPPKDPRWTQVQGEGFNGIVPTQTTILAGKQYKTLWVNGSSVWTYDSNYAPTPIAPGGIF